MVASLVKTVLFFSNIPVTCSHCLGFDAVGESVFDFRLVELQILCDTYTIETQQSLNIIRYGIIGFFQSHKMDKRPMLKISKATVKINKSAKGNDRLPESIMPRSSNMVFSAIKAGNSEK